MQYEIKFIDKNNQAKTFITIDKNKENVYKTFKKLYPNIDININDIKKESIGQMIKRKLRG